MNNSFTQNISRKFRIFYLLLTVLLFLNPNLTAQKTNKVQIVAQTKKTTEASKNATPISVTNPEDILLIVDTQVASNIQQNSSDLVVSHSAKSAASNSLTATFTPDDGDTNIPFDSNIKITFSEPFSYHSSDINDNSSLQSALNYTNLLGYYQPMITVEKNSSSLDNSNFTASLSTDLKTVTITFHKPLSENTIYTIALNEDIYISDKHSTVIWGFFWRTYISGKTSISFTTKKFIQLDKPENLSVSNLDKDQVTLNWDAVDHNSGYLVTLYDKYNKELKKETVTSTNITMDLSTYSLDQRYTFSVVALGDNIDYSNSVASTYSFSTFQLSLEGLTLKKLTGNKIAISWDETKHATGYELNIQGENDSIATYYSIPKASITTHTFKNLNITSKYTITIFAKGDLRYYLDSEQEIRIYTTLNRYTMTWVAGMGYLSDTDAVSSYIEGNKLKMPTPTSPESWSFTGWSTQKICKGISLPTTLITSAYKPTEDQSFYAVYNSTEIEGTTVYTSDEISILLHTSVNGISTDLTQNSPIASENIANKIIPIDGVTFQGWASTATAINGDNTPPTYFTFPVIDENTLYAIFHCAYDNKYYSLIPDLVWIVNTDTTDLNKTESYNTLIVNENKSLSITKDVNLESVTLKQGATLTINPTKTFCTQYLDIIGNDQSCAQINIPESSSLKVGHGIRFNCKLDSNDRFYFFSLPYDCLFDDISILKNNEEDNTLEFGIYWYDSESYANTATHRSSNWVPITSGDTIKKNQGYIIYNGQNFEVLARFNPLNPLSNYTFDANCKILAKTTSINNTDTAFWNWNLVGTPFLNSIGKNHKTKIKGISNNTTLMVSQPNFNDKCHTYYQKKIDETEILPFTSYFVQVGNTGNISFEYSGASEAPAAYYLLNDELKLSLSTLNTSIDSSNTNELKDMNDALYIDVNDHFTTDYEIGSDLFKMLGKTTRPQFFSISTNKDLVYNALPPAAISAIPLGYYTGTTETYVIKAVDAQNYNATHLYLTDNINLKTVDLMVADYQFEGTAKDYNTARFTLNIVRQNTPTQTDQVNENSIQIFTTDNQFVINQLKKGYNLELIDASGRIIYASKISSSTLRLEASKGIYFIRYTNPLGQAISYKAIMP